MTSYPSPTYSFEESSDYYRVPIGRPTTPVDKIINSLETMPISPIKNNKGELTFTPTTWTTSMDLYKVRPKTSPRPSPTPSPVGTPPLFVVNSNSKSLSQSVPSASASTTTLPNKSKIVVT